MTFFRVLEYLGISLACAVFSGCTIASQGLDPDKDRGALPTKYEDLYGDVAKEIVYPKQNWSPADSLWFYDTSQGSNLMDYHIFKYLERKDSPDDAGKITLFRDYENMNRFRFLPQSKKGNEDWLPVGWVKDSYEGKDYIGFTCAACHTTQVNYNNQEKGISVGIRIDGGPALADFQTMFQELEAALWDTFKNEDKFKRLVRNVLTAGTSYSEKLASLEYLEEQYKKIKSYNQKDDPLLHEKDDPQKRRIDPLEGPNNPPNNRFNGRYGYGRLDAFGRIFNRIESIRSPASLEQYHPANAPVSFPFLWDTPHHDFVQWNGIAGNTGKGGLGPLGRNASEVLEVFATVHNGKRNTGLVPTLLGFGNYSSSLRKWNQVALERKIKRLWSPSWEQLAQDNKLPKTNGLPEDIEEREKLIKEIDELNKDELDAKIKDLQNGPPDWKFGLAVFKKYRCASCHQPINRQDSGRRVIAQFSSVKEIGTDPTMANNVIWYCGQNEFPDVKNERRCRTRTDEEGSPTGAKGGDIITHLTGEVLANGVIWDLPVYAVAWANNPWKSWIPGMTTEADRHVDFEVVNKNDAEDDKLSTYLNVYKGRPLNGIWATAPYLHNGSVPNLYELFLPSSCIGKNEEELIPGETCRSKTFTVGTRELDTFKVGFKQLDVNKFPELVFDTSLLGNLNTGHEYAVGVTGYIKTDKDGIAKHRKSNNEGHEFEKENLDPITYKERLALIEYLKSL